ncbi:LLM class flavin-dependent oxidoreductase [Nocardia takedensis]
MTGHARTLHLNINLRSLGSHGSAWRVSPAGPSGYLRREYYQDLARTAERGLFDAIFLADIATALPDPAAAPSWSLDPAIVATTMGEVTEHLGFIVSNTTTFDHPYALARRFSSLDHILGGRVGWNIVTSYEQGVAANFGSDRLPSHADRYARADEFVTVVQKLWDSWEEGAIATDPAAPSFADPERIHRVDHVGERFRVRGPSQVPRSPQGRPLLVQAGSSEPGRDLAAKYADAVFTSQLALSAAQEYYADIGRRARAYGRDPDRIAVLPGLSLVIGDTEQAARQRKSELDDLHGGIEAERVHLARRLGIDPDDLPLDRPVPQHLLAGARAAIGSHGFADAAIEFVRRENPTARELIAKGGGHHHLLAGTPEQIADTMQTWFREGAADGFNVGFDVFPTGLESFVDHVVPELQRRGLFRRSYGESPLLRDRYGAATPRDTHAAPPVGV